MNLRIIKAVLFILFFNNSQGYPFEFMKLRPITMSAPLSQIQWNNRGDWQKVVKVIDMEPRSYHMQKTTFNDVISTIKHQESTRRDEDKKKSAPRNFSEYKYFFVEDQMMIPSLVGFTVTHPLNKVKKQYFPEEPKSLEISYQPTLGDTLSKLKITDTFLDAIQQITTESSKKKPSATTHRKPQKTTKRPTPHDKPQPRPNKILATKQVSDYEVNEEVSEEPDVVVNETSPKPLPLPNLPQNNNLAGHSQIGNRESQMVIKPTVIVNIRGTVSNRDSDIKVESRMNEDDSNNTTSPQNIININQEINFDKNYRLSIEDDETKTQTEVNKPFFDEKPSKDAQSKSLKTIFLSLGQINQANSSSIYLKEDSDVLKNSDDDIGVGFMELMKTHHIKTQQIQPIVSDAVTVTEYEFPEETTTENEILETLVFEGGSMGGFLTSP